MLGEDNPCCGPYWGCQGENYGWLPGALKRSTVWNPFWLSGTSCPCYLCVFSSHKCHRASKSSSFLLLLRSSAVVYLSKMGRGYVYVFTARIESCLRRQSLKLNRPLCYFKCTNSSCSFSSVLPHSPFPLFQGILILLELFSSSLLIAYTTYLATTV